MADIPVLVANITEDVLVDSARLHNQFPPDTPFPTARAHDLDELGRIIAKYDVQQHFYLQLLHHHITIPEGQVLLGTSNTEPLGYWTSPTPIREVDLQNIHGHIFSVYAAEDKVENAVLFPSEFRGGPPVNIEDIDSDFFKEFVDYLRTNGLENTFGLAVVEAQVGKMIEFSFNIGSLLVDKEEMREEVRRQADFRVTAWAVVAKDGNVLTSGEQRCLVFANGDHHPITDKKVTNASEALKVLQEQRYIG